VGRLERNAMTLRALIVDDERLARAALRDLLRDEGGIVCVGEAANGRQALAAADELRPDVIFLDICLPGLDGLEVLRRLERAPHVVFTTAHDRYAVEAFEMQAIDYLLKPFGKRRLQQALARIRAASPGTARSAYLERLFVRERGRIVPLRVETAERFDAAGDYTRVLAADRAYLSDLRLGELEAKLDPQRFVRIHRSRIVNLDRVAALRWLDGGRLALTMLDGDELVASRRYSSRLRDRLPGSAKPRR